MASLVPAAYSTPVPDPALTPGAYSDPAFDSPPVPSTYADPAPEAGSPANPDPAAIASHESDSSPGSETWLDALRLAMERKPRMFGYRKSAWTAPLLGRYLLDTQGVTVTIPQLRRALKYLGYRWKDTHYVRPDGAHPDPRGKRPSAPL